MKVMVAMSGGVDSSVAAHLMRAAGHDAVGVTMKLWGGESDTGCCAVSDTEDARRVAQQLGMDHHVFNFGDRFQSEVVDPYVDAHQRGLTPNPCIECNRKLKFDALTERAAALGFDAVATGHHARVVDTPDGPRLGRGADRAKDQSYVLYPVTSRRLARVLLPLGALTKRDVREIAAGLGLRTAAKPESQDVCFITRKDGRAAFLEDRIELHPGTVVDTSGRPLGTVAAVETVTVGQRRGLGIAGNADRRYVVDVDASARTVTLGSPDHLMCDELSLHSMVWADAPAAGAYAAQTSAHGETAEVTVAAQGPDEALVRFAAPHRRVARGQSVVIYDGEVVVGGGLVT